MHIRSFSKLTVTTLSPFTRKDRKGVSDRTSGPQWFQSNNCHTDYFFFPHLLLSGLHADCNFHIHSIFLYDYFQLHVRLLLWIHSVLLLYIKKLLSPKRSSLRSCSYKRPCPVGSRGFSIAVPHRQKLWMSRVLHNYWEKNLWPTVPVPLFLPPLEDCMNAKYACLRQHILKPHANEVAGQHLSLRIHSSS